MRLKNGNKPETGMIEAKVLNPQPSTRPSKKATFREC